MVARVYKHLAGMELEFVSARLDENVSEKTIGYSAKFKLSLDFLNFKVAANLHIPGFLDNPLNAIRPEVDGLATHYAYNYLFSAAGNISTSEALFKVFTRPEYYMSHWSTGGLESRYGVPDFEVVDGQLHVTARLDYRLDGGRQIQIRDLPIIYFQWQLNLLLGDSEYPELKSPETKVVLMYGKEPLVSVEGKPMYTDTRYMIGRELAFGDIGADQIHKAG
ncbi:hypothetical protein ACIP1X_19560 [Pseudomonas sp. NPDC088885]|uniref:hypothetical protein n=1 Tax=Pseudomonas sp. NPDC088885 TaxID=3364457 RepID=UPI00381ADD05